MQIKLLPPIGATMLAVALTCAGCAGPAVNRSGPLPSSNQVNNGTVLSEEGPFQFTGVTISQSYSGANVAGRVTNNTPKRWTKADFEVTVFDDAGKKLGSTNFLFRDFLPGQTQLIDPGAFQTIYLKEDRKIRSFDLKFVNGTYEAKYVFAMTEPVASGDMVFSDDLIEVRFRPTERQIGFKLHNKGSAPVKVDWNSAAFVDIAGASHKVMHNGVKYAERNNVLAPTMVPPGASITDFVYPTDYVTHLYSGERNHLPMFPDAPKARSFKGQSFSVFLPVEVGGKVKNYNFVFHINDVIS